MSRCVSVRRLARPTAMPVTRAYMDSASETMAMILMAVSTSIGVLLAIAYIGEAVFLVIDVSGFSVVYRW